MGTLYVLKRRIGTALAVGLGTALALWGCSPTVGDGSDSGTGNTGACAPGADTLSYATCIQPLIDDESCATCHSITQPAIPMDLIAPASSPSDFEINHGEIMARATAGEDSLLILYLWDGPRNPDPTHPVLFGSLDEPIAQMLLSWIDCPRLNDGDPCMPPPPMDACMGDDPVQCVIDRCNPADPATLTFQDCVEPLLTTTDGVGIGTGCYACHSAEINRPDVLNFHIIPNDFRMPSDALTNINFLEATNYSNDDAANARRLDTIVNMANPENNIFLFQAFHQVYNACLYGPTGAFPVTYANANGLPAGNHPNTAFACDYTNQGPGWLEAELLAEIWYYWVVGGAVVY